MKREVIYVRVSTFDQSCERQIADLTEFAARAEYDVLDIHKETNSGTKTNPHPRNQVMTLAQARKIDAVLVGELGQWGRFTQDLLDTQNQLAGWNVSVVAMNGMTSERESPHGRMMATVFAGIAQFERDLMSEPINPASLPSKRAAPSGADTPVNARSQNASPQKSSPLSKRADLTAGSPATWASAKIPSWQLRNTLS